MKKKTPQNPTSGFIQRLTRIRCGETPWLIGALTLLAAALSAPAGSFSANFNSGSVPTNSAVYGNAYISTGGISNTDCLHLTDAANSQQGSFVITPDLDQGTPVVSFTAQFKALFGGGSGANGFSFNFAPDVPLDSFGEDGVGTGLSIPFDSYQDVGESAPGIRIAIGGSGNVYIDTPMNLDLDTWVDVFVQYNSDTTVTVIYNGVYAVSNYSTGWVPPAGSIFGFGGRTGAVNDNHWIDNLTICQRIIP